MASVDMSLSLQSSASKVWELIGGFDGLPAWLPPIAKSSIERHGEAVRRRLTLQDGAIVVEELLRHDDRARSCSYAIIDSPLPISGYRAELSVGEAGTGSVVRWRSTFEPKGASEADAAAVIRGVYQAGFDSLKQKLG